jgi:alpha-glucosidase
MHLHHQLAGPAMPAMPEPWWRETVIYQIYPRSFADSNGDGIGDLAGVVDRLDYLADLGVDVIWLSPFYPSPLADFGYDVSDHCEVDPSYGSLADFDRLVAEAHGRGIRIIVDLVMNHTAVTHRWFVDSRSSRSNTRRDWYIWADPALDGSLPNNWLSAFARCGPAWTFDQLTGQYYLHTFTPGQPDLNWRNPSVWEAMRHVWRFWLDRGVDGFRIDVAHRLMKDPLLRDNPPEVAAARRRVAHPTQRQRNVDLPEVHSVLQDLRRVVDSYPGSRLLLGEVPISDPGRLARYVGSDRAHTVFHVGFWEQPWEAAAFRAEIDRLAAVIPPEALPTYALATHDIGRAVSRYGEPQARVAAMMLLTLRGLPCIYYGEEIGMAEIELAPDAELDVDGRDRARGFMQWDPAGHPKPWLPHHPHHTVVNVARQRRDSASLLSLYRQLTAYRRLRPALRQGDYVSLDTAEPVFAFLRRVPGEELLVALNFSANAAQVRLPELPQHGHLELSTEPARAAGFRRPGQPAPGAAPQGGETMVGLRPLRLRPHEGVIVRLGGE